MIQQSKGELRRKLIEAVSGLTAMERIQFEKKFSYESLSSYSKKELVAMLRRCAQMHAAAPAMPPAPSHRAGETEENRG